MITRNIPDRRRPRRWLAAGRTRKQIGRTRAVRVSPGRIGRWSARHPWLALTIWLAFVLGCVAAGAAAGTKTLSNGLVGESARGYAVMGQYGLPPPRVYAYLHSGALVSSEPGFAAAARGVAQSISALGLRPAKRFPRTATRSWCRPARAGR